MLLIIKIIKTILKIKNKRIKYDANSIYNII